MDKTVGTKLMMDAFNRYIEENNIELTSENANDILQDFMKVYNENRRLILEGKIEKTDEEKIADLLNESEKASSKTKAKKLVEEALKINPNHVNARLHEISLIDNPIKEIERLYQLLDKEKTRIERYEKENSKIDNYYYDLEGRDFLFILFHLSRRFIDCGMYRRALETCGYMVSLDEDDHLQVHNDIISMLIHLEDFEEAEKWLDGYQEDTPISLVFKSLFYFKQADFEEAENKIKQMKIKYPEIVKLMTTRNLSERAIEKIMYTDLHYLFEELMQIINDSEFLFEDTSFFDWMIQTMKQVKTTSTKRKKSVVN